MLRLLRGGSPEATALLERTTRFDDGVDDALSQTEQLLAIFQALLRIGALEGGVGRQRFARVDLSEVMDLVYLALQPVAEEFEDVRDAFLHGELASLDDDLGIGRRLVGRAVPRGVSSPS